MNKIQQIKGNSESLLQQRKKYDIMTSRRRRIPVGVYVFRPHIHQGALSSNLMSLPTVFYCPPPVRAIFSLYITGENPSYTNLTKKLQQRQKKDIIQP